MENKKGYIYKHTNLVTNKVYIGRTVNPKRRFSNLLRNYKNCKAFYKDLVKYGVESIQTEILIETEDLSNLGFLEEEYINKYNSLVPNGYNLVSYDAGLTVFSDEVKNKIREARRKYLASLTEPLKAVNKKEHVNLDGFLHKHCANCGEYKLLEDFGKNSRRWDGLHMYCKPCWSEYNSEHRPEKMSQEDLAKSYELRKEKIKESNKKTWNDPEKKKQILDAKNSKSQYLIFDFERKDPVKMTIWKSIQNPNKQVIYARNCELKEISSIVSDVFTEANHLQGKFRSKVNLGLFYKDELVAVMTFSPPRYNKNYEYELIRFCNKLNTRVVGGASKLLKHFIKTYNPKSIISYANLRFSQGNMYEKLGFTKIGKSTANYFYVKDDVVYSRIKCQKHKLKGLLDMFDPNLTELENMEANGFKKVCDRGNLVYELTFTNNNDTIYKNGDYMENKTEIEFLKSLSNEKLQSFLDETRKEIVRSVLEGDMDKKVAKSFQNMLVNVLDEFERRQVTYF
jgi:hypothetical protein